jgi:hypothetical protein
MNINGTGRNPVNIKGTGMLNIEAKKIPSTQAKLTATRYIVFYPVF